MSNFIQVRQTEKTVARDVVFNTDLYPVILSLTSGKEEIKTTVFQIHRVLLKSRE